METVTMIFWLVDDFRCVPPSPPLVNPLGHRNPPMCVSLAMQCVRMDGADERNKTNEPITEGLRRKSIIAAPTLKGKRAPRAIFVGKGRAAICPHARTDGRQDNSLRHNFWP